MCDGVLLAGQPVLPYDFTRGRDPKRFRPVCAWIVDGCECAVVQQESMFDPGAVNVTPSYVARGVDAPDKGLCGAWIIDRREAIWHRQGQRRCRQDRNGYADGKEVS